MHIKIYSFVLFLSCLPGFGQFLELNPSNGFDPDIVVKSTNPDKQVIARFQGVGQNHTSLYIENTSNSNSYVGIGLTRNSALRSYFGLDGANNFFIGVSDNSAGDFKISGQNNSFGYVGIGLGFASPTAKLEVNGFTKLGSDSPAIKIKKILSTTRSTEGTQVTINHGLTESKILSISVMVDTETNDFVHPSFRNVAGYEFEWTSFNGAIYVKNVAGNSSNILSKPIRILITYEE